MKQKTLLTTTLLGGALAGMVSGAGGDAADADGQGCADAGHGNAPATRAADLLAGKTYPLTLKAEQIDASYHIWSALVDAQGQSAGTPRAARRPRWAGRRFWSATTCR